MQNEELRCAQGELEQLVAARAEELRRANEELRADIAERRRAEAALRQCERRYRDVVENLHEGLWLIDPQNRTTFANPYLAKMLGYTPEEMLGRSLFVFLDEAAAAMCQEHLDRCRLNLRETHDLEFRCRDGRRIHTRLPASPILDEQGRYAGAGAAVRDITQRLALEREVLQISEREQRRIGEDLHDGLGQELTAIELLCSSLKNALPAERPDLREQTERMGGLLRNAIRQTQTLAHGLTGFRMTSRSLSAALAELAQSVSSPGRVLCHFKGASVSLDDAATAGHLDRIAQEAVHNAVKHAQASQVMIFLSEQAGALLLAMSDNGRDSPTRSRKIPGWACG